MNQQTIHAIQTIGTISFQTEGVVTHQDFNKIKPQAIVTIGEEMNKHKRDPYQIRMQEIPWTNLEYQLVV